MDRRLSLLSENPFGFPLVYRMYEQLDKIINFSSLAVFLGEERGLRPRFKA